jgi:hypothetical protein
MSLRRYVETQLRSDFLAAERKAWALDKDLKDWNQSRKRVMRFRVVIDSLWVDQGIDGEDEKSIAHEETGQLANVMKKAIELFKETNHRSDVQGTYRVYVVFPSGSEVLLPDSFYMKYHEQYGVYQPSQEELRQREEFLDAASKDKK